MAKRPNYLHVPSLSQHNSKYIIPGTNGVTAASCTDIIIHTHSTQVGNTDLGTGTHFTVNPALPTTAGIEGGHRLPTTGMEGGHRPPTYIVLVTDTPFLLLPRRPMQTTWQPYAHMSNTHEMSEYTEDKEDLPSPVEETMSYEQGRGVVQYSVEETGQHRTQEMVSGRLPF